MEDTRLPKKSTELKVSWKKTCWKTKAERERHCHDGLLIAAEHKEDGNGQWGTGITEGELHTGCVKNTRQFLKFENQCAHYVPLPFRPSSRIVRLEFS